MAKADTKAPAFQFYPREFLASEKVLMMTPEEVGGYVFLLCHAWISTPPCSLPTDITSLSKLSRLGEKWEKCSEKILSCFITKEGRLYNERLLRCHMERRKYLRNQSKAGKKGMEKRWADRYNDVINRNKSSSASSTASSPAVKKTRQRHLKTAATDAASPPASVTETIKQKPPHVEFMDRFKAFYERITSQPFNDDKKHYAMADRLVRKHGLEAVIAKAKTLGFLCRDRSAWFAKGGFADFTIEKLSSQWNSILVEAAQPTKEQKGRDEEEQARKKWEAHNARVDSILKRGGSNSNRGGVGEVVPVAGSTATEREESPVDSGDR